MNLHRLRSRAVCAACGACLLCGTCFLCGTAFLGGTAALATGPNSNEPEAMFPAGPLQGNQEEHMAAVEAYQHAVDLVRRIIERYETSGIKKSMLLEIGKAQVALDQAQRRIDRLNLVGEPASIDLELRGRDWKDRLLAVRDKILGDAEISKLVAGTEQKWLAEAAKLQKSISKAERLAEQEQWDAAAQVLYELIDRLTPQGMWYDISTFASGISPFRIPLSRIEPELFTLLRARAADERRQAIARELPDFATPQRDVDAAIQGVAAAGKGSLDGQELAGPGLLAAVGVRWRQVQLGAWRARAHYWGLQQQVGEGDAELRKLEQDHERFTGAMVAVCAQLIEADAGRADAGDVAALHQQYVQALVPLFQLDPGRTLASGVGQALDKLAAKSPDFAAGLAAYSRATSDLLRWRERAAAAQVRRRQADYPESAVNFNEILRCNLGDDKGAIAALDASKTASANSFSIMRRAPDLIAAAKPKVAGQKARFNHVASPAAGGAVAMYEKRHYARLAPDVDLSATVAELKQCLFAQDASPPLTLEAYAALATAEDGHCEQVGGQIEAFELEAVLTRFVGLGDADWGLVTLGSLPREGSDGPIRQLLVGFSVKPAWARHRYGFVEVKAE